MRTKEKKGVSLIILVITILVMLILAGVVIVSLQKDNPIEKAKEARFRTNLASATDLVGTNIVNELAKNSNLKKEDINYTEEELKKIIPGESKFFQNRIGVREGNLYLKDFKEDERIVIEQGALLKFLLKGGYAKNIYTKVGNSEWLEGGGVKLIHSKKNNNYAGIFGPDNPKLELPNGVYTAYVYGENLDAEGIYIITRHKTGVFKEPFKILEKTNNKLKIQFVVGEGENKNVQVNLYNETEKTGNPKIITIKEVYIGK